LELEISTNTPSNLQGYIVSPNRLPFGLFSMLGLSSKIWYKYGEIKTYISETLPKSEKEENIALSIEIPTLF